VTFACTIGTLIGRREVNILYGIAGKATITPKQIEAVVGRHKDCWQMLEMTTMITMQTVATTTDTTTTEMTARAVPTPTKAKEMVKTRVAQMGIETTTEVVPIMITHSPKTRISTLMTCLEALQIRGTSSNQRVPCFFHHRSTLWVTNGRWTPPYLDG
jgi:hypothetical protein